MCKRKTILRYIAAICIVPFLIASLMFVRSFWVVDLVQIERARAIPDGHLVVTKYDVFIGSGSSIIRPGQSSVSQPQQSELPVERFQYLQLYWTASPNTKRFGAVGTIEFSFLGVKRVTTTTGIGNWVKVMYVVPLPLVMTVFVMPASLYGIFIFRERRRAKMLGFTPLMTDGAR